MLGIERPETAVVIIIQADTKTQIYCFFRYTGGSGAGAGKTGCGYNPASMSGLLRAYRAVFGAMIGIRRGADARSDFSQVRFWQLAVAGLSLAAALVAALVAAVGQIAG